MEIHLKHLNCPDFPSFKQVVGRDAFCTKENDGVDMGWGTKCSLTSVGANNLASRAQGSKLGGHWNIQKTLFTETINLEI